MRAPLPPYEARRLEVLRSLDLLDTASEATFDALTMAAQSVASADIALVSIVDQDRQWFKSTAGDLNARETHRDHAFCAHAILQPEVFCVEDATLDARFSDNPYVTGGLGIRAYAGAPITVDGQNIGTVCTISKQPRGFDANVREQLTRLAGAAAELLEARRRAALQQVMALAASEAVVVIDTSRRVMGWSPAAEALMGDSAEQAIGRDVLAWTPEDQRARRAAGLARALRRSNFPRAQADLEVQVLGADGAQRGVRMAIAPWRSSGGGVLGAIIRLRAVARPGTIQVADTVFDLGELFEDVLEVYRRPAERQGLAYALAGPPRGSWVRGDPRHLTHILSSLASNAVKFTGAGSIRIGAARFGEKVWRFKVADTGCGFTDAAAARLFDRRGGLGLPIARELARAMGGDLVAAGRPDQGAEFTLTLALAAVPDVSEAGPVARVA